MNINEINLQELIKIVKLAGDAIMKIYQKDFEIEYKKDNSPLTIADKASNEIICENLIKLYPSIPIISEENKQISYDIRKNWKQYWCIDPLDGTKEFIKKNDEFTVNLALIEDGEPVIGIVYAPALMEMYYAKKGYGAFKDEKKLPLFTNTAADFLTIVASRSHISPQTTEFIESLKAKNIKQISKGSSLKLCMVAQGLADIYPRLAPTMEWDTAAADAIVRQSGKMTYEFEKNTPLRYNKENLLNPWFIVK